MEKENASMRSQNVSLEEFLRELEERDSGVGNFGEVVEIEAYELDSLTLEDWAGSNKTTSESMPRERQVDVISEKVRQLEKERDEIADFLSRQQKDFENYRRRVERERLNIVDDIMVDFAKKLLPIVDNLDRAIDAVKGEPLEKSEKFKHFLEGIVLVNQQLYELLAEMGVSPIPSVGEVFDPHLHEAIVAERNEDVPHSTVVAELLRGYRMGEKVIRHALVKVAVNPSRQEAGSD